MGHKIDILQEEKKQQLPFLMSFRQLSQKKKKKWIHVTNVKRLEVIPRSDKKCLPRRKLSRVIFLMSSLIKIMIHSLYSSTVIRTVGDRLIFFQF